MTMALKDRVYVLTGAAGGIGSGTARALLDAGARVTMVDLESPIEAAWKLGAAAGATLPMAADVTSEDDARRVVAATVERFGRLDGLVQAAGVIAMDSAWDATRDDWRRQLDVNVTGSFLYARAVAEHLAAADGGAIVLVASNCGKVGYPRMAAYNASKAAVIGLTRSLATEWAAQSINVNAVCPGSVDTPMLEGVATWLAPRLDADPGELLDGMVSPQLGRKIEPVEVGRVIAFLLSDDATIIRGQAINVDGGETPY